jgi:uncharacterized protein YciI
MRYHGAPREEIVMLFVIHALDKKDEMPVRAKHYRDHRIHLDRAEDYDVDVITAGTLLADDGETPCGSVFVIEAPSRAALERFVRSDPYHLNGVWDRVDIHGYSKKRGTPIISRRAS